MSGGGTPSLAGGQARLPVSIRVGDADVAVWPEGQRIEPLSAPLMAVTVFADPARYHGDLAATILEMERDPAYRMWIFKGGCGMKVRRHHQWNADPPERRCSLCALCQREPAR